MFIRTLPQKFIINPDTLGSHVYWQLGPWRHPFFQKFHSHTWPLGVIYLYLLTIMPLAASFFQKSHFHTWPLGVTCLLYFAPWQHQFSKKPIFPKIQFIYLTPWGHMSIDHYTPGSIHFPKSHFSKNSIYKPETPWGHMSIDHYTPGSIHFNIPSLFHF